MKDGFIKVAAAAPELRVADPKFNAEKIVECVEKAREEGVKVLVFPELAITGATCGHLYYQRYLLDAALEGLKRIAEATRGDDMLVVVGLPLRARGAVYSAAAVVSGGEVLGFTARRNVRGTVFSSLAPGESIEVDLAFADYCCLESEALFCADAMGELAVGVQFAADRCLPVPPTAALCAAGATVVCELSDEPMSVQSAFETRRALENETKRLHYGTVYAAPGSGESTTDKSYSGLCLVVDDGETIAECEKGSGMAASEVDIFNLSGARTREATFAALPAAPVARYAWELKSAETKLSRRIKREPFVPDGGIAEFAARCLDIQATGLIKRMEYTNCWRPVIGVSGGVDSTLVMLACAHAMDRLGLPRKNIVAVTMPCFGTTDRTKNNAVTIAERLGAELRVIPIGESVKKHFETIGHDLNDHSVVFENAQARERTMVLLDIANKVNGLDVGTKDLSEQADGWCTYNGDQISNYDINAGLTKTMVRAIVKYIADTTEDAELAAALNDIWDTPVTPELLPIGDEGELLQKSEDSVGPYILQDFFLWHMVMRGGSPEKVLRLAEIAFEGEFDRPTLIHWLRSYCRRFFVQQFKRSASADGPAVMGFTLSPRDGHKMPSDASNALWLGAVDELE
ncbi:MAG TPA: NAD(+) synthase [Candidatus Scatomorpha merdavium]|nr:NAD(+) synthase [Candidatus Scatomorpha merdavium]